METKDLTFKTITKEFIMCPECGKGEFSISHLGDNCVGAGPWYCDECGFGINLEIKDKTVRVWEAKSRKIDTLNLLRKDDLWLVVNGMRFKGLHYRDEMSSTELYAVKRYYYEEGTCPTNYFNDTIEIFKGNYKDPHGIFDFISCIDATPEVLKKIEDSAEFKDISSLFGIEESTI